MKTITKQQKQIQSNVLKLVFAMRTTYNNHTKLYPNFTIPNLDFSLLIDNLVILLDFEFETNSLNQHN